MIRNNMGNGPFNPISYGHSDNLKNNITKTNRSIIRGECRGIGFRDKSDVSLIDIRRVTSIVKNIQSSLGNLSTDEVLIGLEKKSRQPIWSRGRGAFHGFHGIHHFLWGKNHTEVS